MSKKINDLTLGTLGTTMQLETDIAGTTANKINIGQLDARYKTNFLLYIGAIAVAADFPTPAAVLTGHTYSISADVTDNDPAKTNTGLSFIAPTSVYWTGATWVDLGSLSKGLTDGKIFIGDAGNVASQVTMSGEATITNLGAVTLTNSAVIGKVLTGYSSGAGTVAVTDNILQAIQKLNGNTVTLDGLALKKNGTVALTDNWDAGSFEIRSATFQSDVATGTAPFTVASTTVVSNLNASAVNGYTFNQAVLTSSSPSFVGATLSGLTTDGGIVQTSVLGVLSSSTALPNGTTATTQSPGDNTTKIATTAFVAASIPGVYWARTVGAPGYLLPANATDTVGNAAARVPYGYFTGIDSGIAIIDNLSIDGNTILSTSGALNLTPFAGSAVVIDSHFSFDGVVLTALTDSNTTFNAYTGRNITIESVSFDGGVVSNVTGLSMNGTFTNTALSTANGIVRTDGSGVFSSSTALPDGTTGTTQSPGDNTTKVATTAFVAAAIPSIYWSRVTGTPNYLLPSTASDDIGATGARINKIWSTAVDSAQVVVDNLLIDLNTISSTSGNVNITPVVGSAVVFDTYWSLDGNTITYTNPVGSCYINAQDGYGVWVEGVGFDGGLTSTTSLWITGLTTNNGILRTNGSGVVSSSVTLPNGTLGTTQLVADDSTKLATTAFVHDLFDTIPATFWSRTAGSPAYILPSDPTDTLGGSAARLAKLWANGVDALVMYVDNVIIDGNGLQTVAGNLTLVPTTGSAVVIDNHWSLDGATLTSLTNNNTVMTAYAGKNITIESVTFDGGVVAGVTTLAVATSVTVPLIKAESSAGVEIQDDGGNVALKIYDGGNVTRPTSCKFRAYNSVADSNVTGDDTKYPIICNVEDFDIGGNYNAGTGVFTAPVNGYYKFDAAVSLTMGTIHNDGRIFFTINSVDKLVWRANNTIYGINVDKVIPVNSGVVYMAATQTCILKVQVGAAGAKDVTVDAVETWFSGELIG